MDTQRDPGTEGCTACRNGSLVRIGNSAGPAAHEHGARPEHRATLRPVVKQHKWQGQTLAVLTAEEPTAGWLLPQTEWWARPRTGSATRANATWSRCRCGNCGRWRLTLVATSDMRSGTEIVVDQDQFVSGGQDRPTRSDL